MPGKRGLSTEERFWTKVKKGASDECWEWGACRNDTNYGIFRLNGKNIFAHRLALILVNRLPDPKLAVLHKCDNPPCVNPDHLWAGTQIDNIVDMNRKLRGNQGERHGLRKLTNEEVLKMRELYAGGMKIKDIAALLSRRPAHVCRVVNRRSWTHI